MAKTKISEFSSTPANNTDIDSINIAEGCAPSNINDAIRELMAQLKDFQIGSQGDSFNGPIGTTTAAAGAFTTLSASSTVTLSGGTANGVTYLNGSKVLTSGSALTFDGTKLGFNGGLIADNNLVAQINSPSTTAKFFGFNRSGDYGLLIGYDNANDYASIRTVFSYPIVFSINNTEAMRLTSTGLGIGTSSPVSKIDARSASAVIGNYQQIQAFSTDSAAIDLGGGISLGGYYSGTAGLASFGTIVGRKENSTAGNYNGYLAFGTNAQATGVVERMRIDSAGNLGLGVTPSASSNLTNIEMPQGVQIGARKLAGYPQMYLSSNVSGDAYGPTYKINGYATQYRLESSAGKHEWYTAPSGTAGNAISFTQAMTLDASGNLVLGTTTANATLHAQGASTTDGSIKFNQQLTSTGAYNTSPQSGSMVACKYDSSGNLAGMGGWSIGKENATDGNYSSYFAMHTRANGGAITERARIDSSGSLLVGLTSASSGGFAGGTKFAINAGANVAAGFRRAESSGTNEYIRFTDGDDADCGSIDVNATANTTAYNTSSDYRLKQDIAPMTGALAKVAVLNPCTWNWKHAPEVQGQGFIAHELAEVVPDCVTGVKDEVDQEGNPVYQGIDTSFLVATLTAAIQEQQAIIESLKARLDAANL